jgi:ribosomal protein S6--L-glutamate ligase
MKIILLSRERSTSDIQLLTAARSGGHSIKFVRALDCSFVVKDGEFQLFYRNKPFPKADCVLLRNTLFFCAEGAILARQLEAMNIPCINKIEAVECAGNKLRTLQILAKHGIPVPKTGFSLCREALEHVVEKVGGKQQIIKTVYGSWGTGTLLAGAPLGSHSLAETLQLSSCNPLIQQFIEDAFGTSIRVFVIAGRIVASVEYESTEGDFRSNFSRGGTGHNVILTKQERQMALQATHLVGLDYAGVDIVRSDEGPFVLEVNASPGTTGVNEISGIDVAGMVIEECENIVKLHKQKNFQSYSFEKANQIPKGNTHEL